MKRLTQPIDSLRALFERRLKEAIAEAECNGGSIPPARVTHLAELARIMETSRASAAEARPRRWPVLFLLALTLALASLLLFVHVRQTAIEADLAVSELSFETRAQQPIARAIHNLSSLNVAGVRRVHLPGFETATADEADLSVVISVREGKRPGRVSLAQLALPASTRVLIRRADLPNQFRMVVEAPKHQNALQLRVDLDGSIRIASRVTRQRNFDLGTPDQLVLEMASNEVDVLFTMSSEQTVALLPQIPVRNLSLIHAQQFIDAGEVGWIFARRVSGILTGTVYLEELGNSALPIRAGELLRFQHSEGQIRQLAVDKDQIAVNFSGVVRGMETGPEDHPRNLMPTLLEWLKAQQGLLLLWGTVLYVVSVSAGVLRWLGVKT